MQKSLMFLTSAILVLSLSACEDKAEKRAKLQAQIEAAEDKVSECVYDNLHKGNINNCQDLQNEVKVLQSELDKLNGVKS